MTTNFSRRRYGIFELMAHIFKRIYECLDARCHTRPQSHERRLYVGQNFSVVSLFYWNFISSFQECDAAIVTTSYAYESVSLDAVKQWFSDMQKEVHILGPLLPPDYGNKTQNSEEGKSVGIEKFLEEMLVQHGERSVFFVRSFSIFYCRSNFIHKIFIS